MYQSERWMLWLTGGIAFFGLCTVVAAFLQWDAMRGQLGEMKGGAKDTHDLVTAAIDQANAAKKSADTAENSFRVERRRAEDMEEAICTLTGGGGAAYDNFYQVSIGNNGKVTAREIKAHVEVSLNAVPSNKRIRALASTDISMPELGREKDVTQKLKLPLSSEDWQNIADTKEIIEQSATITYENGFERVISNNRCDMWLYYRTPQDKLNPIQGRGFDCSRLPEQLAAVPKP